MKNRDGNETLKNLLSSDPDYELILLLVETDVLINKARNKELQPFNISGRKSAALFMIKALGEKATPANISRQLSLEPHSISELINRMEKQGLVKKVKDLPQKNQVRVTLTEKGIKAYNQSAKREFFHRIMSSLSTKERQHLKSCLLKLQKETAKEI